SRTADCGRRMLLRLIPLLLASHLISSPNPFHFLFFSLVKVPMLRPANDGTSPNQRSLALDILSKTKQPSP
ncbi:hypothetical protein B0J15DRAFT_488750, partial [Fusarium solani]